MTKRREFIKKSALGSAGIVIGGMGFSSNIVKISIRAGWLTINNRENAILILKK